MHTQIGPRTGVADSGHFDGFRVPLSSAPFCICFVIRDFSKTTEASSLAGTAISHPCGHPPVPTGKVNRFPTNSGHFSPANPHNSPLIPLAALKAEGPGLFDRLPPRHIRHLRHFHRCIQLFRSNPPGILTLLFSCIATT